MLSAEKRSFARLITARITALHGAGGAGTETAWSSPGATSTTLSSTAPSGLRERAR